ncbi:MAG: sulfate adenylyltransferase [Myxococcota bacterium]
MSLVPVHGGLSEPVNRMLKHSQRAAITAEAASLPKIVVTEADLATVHRLADGTLSPLTGPMTEAQHNLVLNEQVIESNGQRYAWTIPVTLPVTDAEAATLSAGTRAAIHGPDGSLVGVIDVTSVFDWDKPRYLKAVYRTDRTDHPGGRILMDDPRSKLVGGEILAFPPAPHPEYGHQVVSPRMTRALIADRQWDKALAFQTRNPLHRAHEYALVYGLEEITRAGNYAGAILNPLVGQLKSDDVDAVTRMRTYNRLKQRRLLGQGDVDPELWSNVGYDINDVFELQGLDIKMFYGGPSEAVMHAIYRQNHGFTHIVIGRKHADAPYDDGTAIWGDFDAHAIFDDLKGTLAIEPMKVGFAAYYESIGRVDLMSKHQGEDAYFISGKKVRAMLVAGEVPPAKIMRPDTAEILIEAYAAKAAAQG